MGSTLQLFLFLAAAIAILLGTGLLYLVAQLRGRLDQQAKAEMEAQHRLAQSLQVQERAINARLEQVSHRLNDGLTQSTEKTAKTMTDLRERLAVIDAAQKNIAELSTQVVGLQDILANKQARGAFGEVQLQDLVRGVLPASAYRFQATLSNDKRADCLLDLPNPPGPIVIDAKFPLESYRTIRDAKDDASLHDATRRFGTDVLKHVRAISEKYIVPGETAELALMFLPSEAVYAELHANLPDVVEKAHRARVYTVSPSTLWATLNTIRAVLQDVHMREQAHVLQKEVMILLEDVVRLDERVGKLQTHFRLTERDIEAIQTSTRKVTKRAERIGELEVEEGAAEEILPPSPSKPRLVE